MKHTGLGLTRDERNKALANVTARTGSGDNPIKESPMLDANYYANSWLAWLPVWNGQVTNYNPSGRRFKRKELRLMAQQEGFDCLENNGRAVTETADDLLTRAQEIAAIGAEYLRTK